MPEHDTRDFKPYVDDATLKRIGEVIARFQLLESMIIQGVAIILGGPRSLIDAVTSELSFSKLRAVALAVCHESFGDGDLHNRMVALMRRADEVEQKRNAVVHSLWVGTGPNGSPRLRIKVRTQEKAQKNEETNRHLKHTFDRTYTDVDFDAFLLKIGHLCYDLSRWHFDAASMPRRVVIATLRDEPAGEE